MPHRAPLVIIVAARARASKIVSLFEQQLTAGCAVMAMQMAAVAQGFGGIWRSGWPMFDRSLHEALELADDDQIVGFLYLGTPASAPGEQGAAGGAGRFRPMVVIFPGGHTTGRPVVNITQQEWHGVCQIISA